MGIYLNHAATSGIKPRAVIDAVTAFLLENSGQSPGRGGYGDRLGAMRAVLQSRQALAGLFGVSDPARVIFTSGATESLNMAINGLVREGCHVLATGLEHNAVARPLHLLEQRGYIQVTWLACDQNGAFDPQCIHAAVRKNTRLLVMTHASNVIGNILPVERTFAAAKEYGLLTLLDAAQTAGHIDVKLTQNTDAIAFTGHKGLRGLAGCGGLALGENAVKEMTAWKAGGTGSHSQSLEMPGFMPDMLEPGTPNMAGIISLGAAVAALETAGLAAVRAHEQQVTTRFVAGLKKLNVTVYGNYSEADWTPLVSLNAPGFDNGVLAAKLGEEYGVETRSGLHCSPLAHKTIGTYPYGALRFSFGAETSDEEVDYALQSLGNIITM